MSRALIYEFKIAKRKVLMYDIFNQLKSKLVNLKKCYLTIDLSYDKMLFIPFLKDLILEIYDIQ